MEMQPVCNAGALRDRGFRDKGSTFVGSARRSAAHAKAVIDFGKEDGAEGDRGMGMWGAVVPKMTSLLESINIHLAEASCVKLLRGVLRVATVGRPNARKSSLLNLLAGKDVVIVSATPGTTRDVVEVILDLGGVQWTLLDTAGVREEGEEGVNEIEVEGMRSAARDAHVVVGVVDASGANERARGLEAVEDLLVPNGEEEDESLKDDVSDSALGSGDATAP